MDLKKFRHIKGYTQWDLRLKTGIHQTKISLIENGYIKPSDTEQKALAEALNIKTSEINWEVDGRLE